MAAMILRSIIAIILKSIIAATLWFRGEQHVLTEFNYVNMGTTRIHEKSIIGQSLAAP